MGIPFGSIHRVQHFQGRFVTVALCALLLLVCGPGAAFGQEEETESTGDTEAEQSASPEAPESNAPSQEEEAVPIPLPEAEEAPAGLPKDTKSWDLPSNDTSEWDWVLMSSGEWIKGSIDRMRDGDMEFDSDEFDDQVLDMGDIAAFYANRVHTYLLVDGSTVSGRAMLRGNELVVEGQKIERDRLLGIIKGKEEERNYWSGKLNLGLTLLMGNTEQITLTSDGYIRRESAKSRLNLDHIGTYGKVADQVNVQNLTGTVQYDIYLSKRWYFTPIWGIATHDRFKNVDIRTIPGAGAGVHVFQLPVFSWDIDLGGGYQYQRYREIEAGEDDTLHDGVIRVSTWAELDVGKLVDFELTWWTIFVYTDWGTTSHHGQLTFEFEVTSIFELTISAVYDRVEQPASYTVEEINYDVEPHETVIRVVTPKSDDLQLIVGMMVEF